MAQNADISENAGGPPLWSFATDDGRSIRKALDWLLPYALGKEKWPYKQVTPGARQPGMFIPA